MGAAVRKSPYTSREFACAVNLSALLGWVSFTVFAVIAYALQTRLLGAAIELFFWFALFGIPIALLVCWILLAPFLKVMMRKNVSFMRAMRWGAGIGAGLAALVIAIGIYREWRQLLELASDSRAGNDGVVRSVDSILISYEWDAVAQNSAVFILMCVVAAIVVRMVVGSGNQDCAVEARK